MIKTIKEFTIFTTLFTLVSFVLRAIKYERGLNESLDTIHYIITNLSLFSPKVVINNLVIILCIFCLLKIFETLHKITLSITN